MNGVKTAVLTAIGTAGAFIVNNLLGGWTEDLITLMSMMGVDFCLGLLIAAVWKKSAKSATGALSSYSAWKGLCRKGGTLLVVMVAYRLDVTMGVDYIKTGVVIAFIANEAISIVENLGVMGVPLPKVFVKAIEILQDKKEE